MARTLARTSLTTRQIEVLSAVVLSASQKRAAAQLGISPCSVRNHLVRIRRRLGATDTAQAVGIATRDGLLDLPSLDRASRDVGG